MRFSKIYTLHRISENRKSVSTARESRVHFFHEPFFCEHEWDSQKNKIFVHLHKQSVKSKFACALFPHPWSSRELGKVTKYEAEDGLENCDDDNDDSGEDDNSGHYWNCKKLK